MVNLTRTLALGLARRDIRVNSVCPSLTHTSKIKGMLQDEVLVAKFEQRIPFRHTFAAIRCLDPKTAHWAYAWCCRLSLSIVTAFIKGALSTRRDGG
ncbi:NAD(P)-dependent dehydrogenase (short-subunit alcohol dehydrogenase family) [Inquilinus ginsengisoli]|uniref:NAD(P)-dependent dehydrogenase (Short-subunit alcohol dehydrogenase family) n=2 Tax=Inquilinus ginsengisoli TaxID=363840 RepID=A0ABU1JHW2_9PROT|nr:NAD(P)-dependent dehydrogenase (short-subunit alcohol dehydrogenase family) [Inquilinus ginsengisoli]